MTRPHAATSPPHHALVVRCFRLVASLLLATAGTSAPVLADAPFSGEQVIDSLAGVNSVAGGELDGANGGDVFYGASGSSTLAVALRQSDGSWSFQTLDPLATQDIEMADLDGDGDNDLYYRDFGAGSVYWQENDLDNTGVFLARVLIAGGIGGAQGLDAADIDGDNDLDVIVAGRTADGYFWIENSNGDASAWTQRTIATGVNAAQKVVAADLDGDGDLDVAGGSSSGSGKLAWYENVNGDGLTWVSRDVYSSRIGAVAAGDLDLDGDVDLLVQDIVADDIIWWENTAGDGTAWAGTAIASFPTSRSGLQAADLDFDGDLDVIGDPNGDWWENIDKATSWTRRSYSGGTDIFDTDVLDVDQDGDRDILATRDGAGQVSWWENLTCSPADADADGDGVRDGCDVCATGDDTIDSDGDLTPDACDTCPGFDDRVDNNGDGVPDACESAASISIDNVTETEGDSGTTSFTFTVTLTGTAAGGFSVPYSTMDDSATVADGDYVAASGTLNFAGNDGETQTLVVQGNGDTKVEDPETFLVVLGTPSSASVSVDDDTGNGTLANDDTAALSINDPMISEGDFGSQGLVFTVTSTGEVDGGFTVEYFTADVTATTADGDYVADSGTLTFDGADGEQETITIQILGDTKVEPDEELIVQLRNVSRVEITVPDGTGHGILVNDDSATVAIGDVTVAEGDSGTTSATFDVVLAGEVADGFTLPWSTADGTATTADGDYTGGSGTISFSGSNGETQTISVDVVGDAFLEGDEAFTVSLGAPSKTAVTASDDTGIGTITNDDTASLAIGDVTLAEGDSGTSTAAFSVTLTGGVSGGFTVTYGTSDGTATTADGDYVAAAGTLSFDGSLGEVETLSVDVLGDTVLESDEDFTVSLGSPSNAGVTVSDGSGLGTITNDDAASLAIGDVTVAEGDSGTATATFAVTLTGDVAGSFTVPYSTSDGTATTADGDYMATSGTLSFDGTDGEVETISVGVQGDILVEGDETFFVSLGSPSNAAIAVSDGTGSGGITNDDAASLAIDDISIAEGDSGTTAATFTVTLTGAVADAFTVAYSSADGTATTADPDYDMAAGTLNFSGGDGETQTLSVDVQGDVKVENDEIFFVSLGSPSNAFVTVSDGTGVGTLTNDDTATISITDAALPEGDAGTSAATFTVTLTGEVDGVFTVNYSTANGSATTADGDYVAASGILTFSGSDGEAETLSVDVLGDTQVEADETFSVTLGAPSNADVTASDATGTGTITNDDSASVAIDDLILAEGDAGTILATFTVTLTGDVDGGFTVPYATADGTATVADTDYDAEAGVLTFGGSDGETQNVSVAVRGDTKVEMDETFTVELQSPSSPSVTLVDGIGVGTIENDDDGPLLVATKEVAIFASPFETVTYRVVITNLGAGGQLDDPASHEFEDLLPPELEILDADSDSPGFMLTTDPGANAVYGNGTIAPGELVTILIEAEILVPADIEIANQGTIRFDADHDGINDSTDVTDDPSTPSTGDPTILVSVLFVEIPILGHLGLAWLALLLAVLAVRRID